MEMSGIFQEYIHAYIGFKHDGVINYHPTPPPAPSAHAYRLISTVLMDRCPQSERL